VRTLAPDERVVGRDAVALAVLRSRRDPEHLPEQRVQRLRVAVRIARAAPVTESDVQVPVGAEREVAAVVVRERLRNDQQVAPASEIGGPVVERELRDVRVATEVGVVDGEEAPVGAAGPEAYSCRARPRR
jgi:hypothetical protein